MSTTEKQPPTENPGDGSRGITHRHVAEWVSNPGQGASLAGEGMNQIGLRRLDGLAQDPQRSQITSWVNIASHIPRDHLDGISQVFGQVLGSPEPLPMQDGELEIIGQRVADTGDDGQDTALYAFNNDKNFRQSRSLCMDRYGGRD